MYAVTEIRRMAVEIFVNGLKDKDLVEWKKIQKIVTSNLIPMSEFQNRTC